MAPSTTSPLHATTDSSPAAPVRRERKRTWFVIVVVGLALITAQSGAPSPLYPLYAEQWGLSPLVMSQVFAAYIVGLAATLLTTGALSDHIGRRAVAVSALLIAALSMGVLATAQGVGALLVARILQGIASGLGFATLGAAMLDYAPARRHTLVAMINGALPPVCLGLGAVVTGMLVEFFPHPLHLTYIAFLAVMLPAMVACLFLKDMFPRRSGALKSLLPRVSVPVQARPRFLVAAAALAASWSLVGLYLGIGPNITGSLLHIESPAFSGLSILAMTGAGGLAGVLTFRARSAQVMAVGSITLIVGAAAMVPAVAFANVWLFLTVSVIGGIGYGAAFQGGLRIMVAGLPAAQRGSVFAALYLVSYIAFGVPTLVAGLLIPRLGLANVVYGYAAFVVVLAVLALLLQSRINVAEPDAAPSAPEAPSGEAAGL